MRFNLLQSIYFKRTGAEQILILSIVFSILMVSFRIVYTGHLMFLFLAWNLFLAFVPYFITRFLNYHPQWIEANRKFWLAFALWLLFIPNSFYILTDLFHLQKRFDVPFWFDLALIVSFAWNGMLLGILSVRQMEIIIDIKIERVKGMYFIMLIMPLNALGIYIGRYLRYNSWDVIANPGQLFGDMLYLCMHPVRNRFDWSMIICFSFLLLLIYQSMKKMSRELS
jgi:uncharacterized membrane protein